MPTVWQGLFAHMKANDLRFSTLKRVLIGGSACPESLIRGFHDDFGVEVTHAWGMTETSPIGTIANLTPELKALPYDQQMAWRMKQGTPPLGVELKIKNYAYFAMAFSVLVESLNLRMRVNERKVNEED